MANISNDKAVTGELMKIDKDILNINKVICRHTVFAKPKRLCLDQ